MLNKKRIKELEAEIDFKTQVAETRQERYLAVKEENEGLRAEIAALGDEIKLDNEIISKFKKIVEGVGQELQENIVIPKWICGEPKKQGWYFVNVDGGLEAEDYNTSLYYNPAARCRWMRGEKGNAERFEQEVIAYIEAPEYEGQDG